ncbi:MAG: GntR family transcriptional regulator [Spirochaetes bacterium GWB1_59_5]|nr:MAG: GntR family transcriptional regulator [Spirochaetes bacterium GWB1_59_5]
MGDGFGADYRMPPLREQVYGYLKRRLNDGKLKPGAFLDLNALGADLGLSRTPLRDALLRLEAEGFVTIHARRGVVVNALDISAIRNSYQLLGALEASAIKEAAVRFSTEDAERMLALNERMRASLFLNDFDDYYEANLAFHDVYLSMSSNAELKRMVKILKERLYDFPRLEGYLSQWEQASIEEHDELARRLLSASYENAATFARDVHWSFEVQERFIMAYYFAREAALGFTT